MKLNVKATVEISATELTEIVKDYIFRTYGVGTESVEFDVYVDPPHLNKVKAILTAVPTV